MLDAAFVMVPCETCKDRFLVAWPCKGKSVCPSSHFAALHGGVYTGAWRNHDVAGWFSGTGTEDTIRPPDLVAGATVEAQAVGFDDLEYYEFPGGHGLSEQEKHDVVAWWMP